MQRVGGIPRRSLTSGCNLGDAHFDDIADVDHQQHQQGRSPTTASLSSSSTGLNRSLLTMHTLRSNGIGPVFALGTFVRKGVSFLVSAAGPSIEVWNLKYYCRSEDLNLIGHTRPVTALCIDENMNLLYSVARDGIKVWDLDSGRCTRSATGPRGAIYCMAVIGGFLVTGGQDCTVRLYSVVMQQQQQQQHTGHDDDSTAPANNVEFAPPIQLSGHSGFVYALAVVPGTDILYSGGGDSLIICWKGANRHATLKGHKGAVLSLVLDAKHLYSSSRDHSICIWSLETNLCVRVLPSDCELLRFGIDDWR